MSENDFLTVAAISICVSWTTVRVHARWLAYRTSRDTAARKAAKETVK